jgi:hypothetical protein
MILVDSAFVCAYPSVLALHPEFQAIKLYKQARRALGGHVVPVLSPFVPDCLRSLAHQQVFMAADFGSPPTADFGFRPLFMSERAKPASSRSASYPFSFSLN